MFIVFELGGCSEPLQSCLNRHISEWTGAMEDEKPPKPVRWIGSSRDDLRILPEPVKRRVGGALWDAQIGGKAPFAKPLKGFGGASVLEIVDDYDGNTYRAVYTVRFARAVYVFHVFQKKSKRRIGYAKDRNGSCRASSQTRQTGL